MSSSDPVVGAAAGAGGPSGAPGPAGRKARLRARFFVAGAVVAGAMLLAAGCGSPAPKQASVSPEKIAQRTALTAAADQVSAQLVREDASVKAWNSFQGEVNQAEFLAALTKRTKDCKAELQKVRAIKPPSGMTATWRGIVDWFALGVDHCGRMQQMWVSSVSISKWNAELKVYNAKRAELWTAWDDAIIAEANRLGVGLPAAIGT